MPKITALVACQMDYCAAEITHYLADVRIYKDAPICEGCYADVRHKSIQEDGPRWCELPPVTIDMLVED